MRVERLDHLVLTVADIDASCAFYQRVLGMQVVTFGQGRKALAFGRQLALRYRLPVYTVDERYSTTEALSRGAADADAAAACIILEQFLNQHP